MGNFSEVSGVGTGLYFDSVKDARIPHFVFFAKPSDFHFVSSKPLAIALAGTPACGLRWTGPGPVCHPLLRTDLTGR
jgi:hypothetical protein